MSLRKILLTVLFVLLLVRCCTITVNHAKFIPEYSGIDPIAAPYINEYLQLAKERGIVFDNVVTVGFKDIRDGNTVGLTSFGSWFREIDLDKTYWAYCTEIDKKIVVWHEMSHAVCGRIHDYAEDKKYNESDKIGAGFYSDSCPLSIMFPILVSDKCFKKHYSDYVNEMLQRCEPW